MIYFIFVTWGYLVGFGVDNVSKINFDIPFPVATLAHRVWGPLWWLLLFALLNSAIAVSIACFNGGTRTWYAMGRSGVLPKALGNVVPTRKTPDNAIHLEVVVNALAFVLVLIFGADNTFFSWANMITLALIVMYFLANVGVVKYYLTEGRAQFNPILHIVVPLIASVAGGVVVWKSYFSPFQHTGPVFWGLMSFIVLVVVTIVILVVLAARGNEEWLHKAQLVFEESGGH
jgi:amino acid transporter